MGERQIGLLALFGLVAGQAVVWYAAHFYTLFFIQNILKVDQFTTNVLVAWALIFGVGFVVAFASSVGPHQGASRSSSAAACSRR